MAEGRRTFAPVVLVGLGAAVLSAVAGTRAWVDYEASGSSGGGAVASTVTMTFDPGEAPLAGALALVLLACWGVLLVTRGLVRRVLAWLALVTSLGLLATVVTSRSTLPGQLREELEPVGITDITVTWSAWYWVAVLGALVSLAATLAAVRLVGDWPEMGSKYDAPAGRRPSRPVDDADESQALWKAIDEGRDPTDGAIS